MLGLPKYNEKTDKHVHVKKAIHSKNKTIFDFMIHLSNNDSKVINSPFLAVSKSEVKICSKKNNNINNETIQTKFNFVKLLLRNNSIKEYTFSFPLDNLSDLFLLIHNFLSYCPLCD